jgi:SSS family solute:Na+ symporter
VSGAGWIGLYFAAMVAIGWWAERRAGGRRSAAGTGGAEEYYLAGRGLAPLALFFALFGTNCSPFVLMGIPGQSYHDGVGIFGLNAPIIALGIPLSFWWLGVPARAMSARLAALSPAELVAKRLGSRRVGLALFAAFTLFTVPYMVTGLQGCGLALARQSEGALSPRAGALAALGVALAYTFLGGMRATAWTNVVQGALFLVVVVAALVALVAELGGPAAAFGRLAAERPELAVLDRTRPRFEARAFGSYGLAITLTVVCFPHMLVRLMAAGSPAALRASCRLYPLALALLWLPAVLIGVLGTRVVPGLCGTESDAIFPRVVALAFPPGCAVLGTLAVLAAAMSTLDAQLLTLGSMLSRDVLPARERRGLLPERLFLLGVGAATFALYAAVERWRLSIFDLAQLAFSGYVMLFPTLALALLWRRFTAAGALASIALGIAALAAFQRGLLPTFGFLPVLPGFLVALAAAVGVSLVTRPPPPATLARAFGEAESRSARLS